MSITPEEMATEVVKSWISGKSYTAEHLAKELKVIYAAMVDAYYEASDKPRG